MVCTLGLVVSLYSFVVVSPLPSPCLSFFLIFPVNSLPPLLNNFVKEGKKILIDISTRSQAYVAQAACSQRLTMNHGSSRGPSQPTTFVDPTASA